MKITFKHNLRPSLFDLSDLFAPAHQNSPKPNKVSPFVFMFELWKDPTI